MLETFTRKSLHVPGSRETFTICDMSGFAQVAEAIPASNGERRGTTATNAWSGSKAYDVSLAQCRTGDLSAVPASDKILSDIEYQVPMTQMWQTRFDVVGGVPNVPAYLAGHPMNMRRRERVAKEQGPLCIFAVTTVSAMINADVMRKRGVAILALVRLLSNTRPVELYACNSAGGENYAAHVMTRIDTTPLDLARAAHMLTDIAVTRGLGYAILREACTRELSEHWPGGWAYHHSDQNVYRKAARDIYISAVSPNAEALLIPAAHASDKMVSEPIVWLKDMLAQYGGVESE